MCVCVCQNNNVLKLKQCGYELIQFSFAYDLTDTTIPYMDNCICLTAPVYRVMGKTDQTDT